MLKQEVRSYSGDDLFKIQIGIERDMKTLNMNIQKMSLTSCTRGCSTQFGALVVFEEAKENE